MPSYQVVGQSLNRIDGPAKVTGSAQFGVDVKLPGMLWARVLRSPFPHARVTSIDANRARRLPGVKAIVTGKDLPGYRFGFPIKDQLILAQEKVRFVGDPVAAVAAVDEETAEEAAGLIQVGYQELPAVYDPERAMEPGAPILHEELPLYEYEAALATLVKGNICHHFKLRKGDMEKGFQKSDFIFEDTFRTQMVHHAYIEPHAAVARFQPAGRLTVWTNTQSVYRIQMELADALGLPSTSVRVVATAVGGGYGGKISCKIEPFCAVLSQRTGRPVKMVMTRAEEFMASSVRHPATARVKIGVEKDGTLVAIEEQIFWDTGAYAETGPIVCRLAGFSAPGPYHWPHARVDSYCIYTNKCSAASFRGFGVTQTAWAIESALDVVAKELGVDPLDLRLKNAVDEGSMSVTGESLHSVGAKECLKQAAASLDWPKGRAKNVGRGIVVIHKFTAAFTAASAFIKIHEDGSVGLITSAVEIGQGAVTMLAQIAAEELGVSLQDVVVASPDTDATPFDVGTYSSRISFHVGNAVRLAAQDAKEQLLRLAARLLEATPDDLELGEREIRVKGVPARALALAQVAEISHNLKAGPILGRGSFFGEDVIPLDRETGQSLKPTEYWKYAAQAAEVEVDAETGEVALLRLAASADAGYAINPRSVEGQIEGGAMMGLGCSLLEEMHYDNGKLVNPSFMDYHLPTALDFPQINTIIVEKAHRHGPFGAKGVGEGSTPPTAPALANAIASAVGVRVKELPVTSEKVWLGLRRIK